MKGKASRRIVAVAFLGAAMLASAMPADAASRTCRQLQTALAKSAIGRGQPRLVSKYDAAIERQLGEIEKARGQARRAGCGFSLFGGNISQCAMLNAAVERMGRNLDKLQHKRARLAGGGSGRDRRRILAKLDANGCNEEAAATPRAARNSVGDHGSANLFRDLLDEDRPELPESGDGRLASGGGEAGRVQHVLNQQSGMPIEIPPPPHGAGEFRTMCVRTCDGYFYPMSNAATLGDFERDQKNCESSCPGTEMQVFYSRKLDGDPSDMTSAANGHPYRELPSAFLYKRADVSMPQCGCSAARDFSIVAGSAAPDRPQGEANPVSSSIISFPAPEAPKAASAEPDAATEPAVKEIPLSEEKRNVRVVGPRFLPDPEGAIDLRDPAPTTGP
jgi:hypothetical protein